MGFKLIDRVCTACKHTEEYLMDQGEIDRDQWTWDCTQCGEPLALLRKLAAPHIRTSESRTFLDGTVRGELQPLKDDAKLDVAIAQASPQERPALEKERAKIWSKD